MSHIISKEGHKIQGIENLKIGTSSKFSFLTKTYNFNLYLDLLPWIGGQIIKVLPLKNGFPLPTYQLKHSTKKYPE